jgi:hypothetical protein
MVFKIILGRFEIEYKETAAADFQEWGWMEGPEAITRVIFVDS